MKFTGDRCEYVPVKRFPWMAVLRRERARSMNRCLPASPYRWRKQRHEVVGGTVNQTGSFMMRAEKRRPDTLLAQIVRMVAMPSVAALPFNRWLIRCRVFCACGLAGGCPHVHRVGHLADPSRALHTL